MSPYSYGNGATGLSVTRVGSGRARLRGQRAYGEEYAAIGGPVVTRTGVTTLFDSFVEGVSASFTDFAAGRRGFAERTSGGMGLLECDAAGGRAAFIETPTDVGDEYADQRIADALCRIVVAATSGERLLAPRIAISRTTATVVRTTLAGGTVTGRQAVAGVAVELRREGGAVVGRLVTDVRGRVALPAPDPENPLAVVAMTQPRSYGYYGD